MSELWKDIPDCHGKYQVSNTGKVRSMIETMSGTRIRYLKTQKDNKGYLRIRITVDRIKKSYKVHRLVADMFVPNVNDKPQVNHIDGDKGNNNACNLEWVSNIENCNHAIKTGLWKNVFEASRRTNEGRKRPIIATDIRTGHQVTFESISDAERELNTKHINAVIKGNRTQAKGYSFEYARGGDANAT